MKKLYLIQCNLSDDPFFENRIKNLGNWVKYFKNNFIVSSSLNPQQIYNNLAEGYENASIFIIELNVNNYYGRMNTKVWEFLKKNKNSGTNFLS
ncbi:hypothetical protein ACI760_08030 [Capnocytophaga canimorsus]|uniref:Uncharacterized protein n=1 Tax=Capnocytophaga canimorsus TaxID=28188 RepID=A0A0B7I6Z6_9FLAO|nr:hypothetical protein [Capnocytophaga canimorsus]CEN46484.1 conserved hypothetical protein [Capnocytophaga canimorsus]